MKRITITLIASLALASCFHSPKTTPVAGNPDYQVSGAFPPLDDPTTSNQAPEQADDQTMEDEVDYSLELKSFTFTPNQLTASPGQTIKVKLTVTQGFHDFVIDELNVKSSQMSEGQEEIVEITIPSDTPVGTEYEFYCSVGNHRDLGMVGTLIVQ